MSAPSCIAYVGLRFSIADDEVEALEARRDNRQVKAKSAGLKSYWGQFGLDSPSCALLVGTPVGSLGPEGLGSIGLPANELLGLVDSTQERLSSVGLDGQVGLHIEWQPD